MYAALEKEPGIRHVLGRHEQGLGYMADGYARASGKIAAVSITSGPAVANLASAMGQATTDGSAMLVVASTPRSDLVGKNRGGLHDLNDSLDLARTVCRYVDHCANPDEIPGKINALVHQLRTARPGAAFIQIPTDVMGSETEILIEEPPEACRLAPDDEAINEAAALLNRAERPLIIVGTGAMVSGAGPILRQLAELLGAVVSTDVLSRGTVPGDLPYVIFPDGATPTPVNEVFREADVVLAVGTMFRQEDTSNWDISFTGRLIHVDIDPAEFGRSYTPDIAIHSDALAACQALAERLERSAPAAAEWVAYARSKQEERIADRRRKQGPDLELAQAFRKALPRDTILCADRCNLGYWAFRCLPFYEPRTFQYPLGFGGLGGALSQAIGAKISFPDRQVVTLVGDGGIQFTLPELAVAVQESTAVKIIVSNNQCYEAIRAGLEKNYPGTSLGTRLSGPDYAKIAEAYGIPFIRCGDGSSFLAAFKQELEEDRLSLIEFQNEIKDP